MKKIKSFREYIEEQKLLKEADDNENKAGFLKSAEEKVDDREKQLTRDSSDESASENTDDSEKPEEQKKEDSTPPVTGVTYTTDMALALTAKGSYERVKELQKKADIVERTYHDLEAFIDKKEIESAGTNSLKLKQAIVNLTQNNSFEKIKNNWLKNVYKPSIEKQRENQKMAAHADSLESGIKSIFKTKKAKEQLKAHREALAPAYSTEKTETEKKNSKNNNDDNSVDESISSKENILNEITIRNPFATASEYSSGLRSKYNKNKILSKAGDLYSEKLEKEVISKADKNFKNNARAIIAKQKGTGLSYLNRAKKNLYKYLEKHQFLTKISDERFISTISADLQRAMNVLVDIGNDLQNLMKEYNAALNEISETLSTQDAKNIKRVTDTLNTNTAITRYDDMVAKDAEKAQKKEERQNLRAFEKAQKKEERQNRENLEKEEQDKLKRKNDRIIAAVKKVSKDEYDSISKFLKNDFSLKKIKQIYNEALVKLNNDNYFGNTAGSSKNSKSIGIDEHKKALARALLIIVRNRKKFNERI